MKPTLKAPGTIRLNLRYDGPLSSFSFKFNVRRYNKGSKNGTFVNGKRLVPHARRALLHGDVLMFGEVSNAYVYQRKSIFPVTPP